MSDSQTLVDTQKLVAPKRFWLLLREGYVQNWLNYSKSLNNSLMLDSEFLLKIDLEFFTEKSKSRLNLKAELITSLNIRPDFPDQS